MYILGISCWYHDSAACLIRDGEILAAVQEERFSRVKQDSSFPINSIKYCLDFQSINIEDVDYVVFYEDSGLKFNRVKNTWIKFFPRSIPLFFKSAYSWFRFKRNSVKNILFELTRHGLYFPQDRIKTCEHHFSHAAAAFYPSPFDSAAVLVMDGVGEFDTASIWQGDGNSLSKISEVIFPNSIGLLYSTITAFLGFKVNSGEYKVMGLAPYGKPRFTDEFEKLFERGSKPEDFKLNMTYFAFPYSGTMFTTKMEDLFGIEARLPESELNQVHMDIAASLQSCLEGFVINFATRALDLTGEKRLCLSGGVALNCVANGFLIKELGLKDNLWIQPASGDAGSSVGAALGYFYDHLNQIRVAEPTDSMKGSYLGPSFTDKDIKTLVEERRAVAQEFNDADLFPYIAKMLADGSVVGWHQGRAEFGPRSLGNRSILGDPRNVDMQSIMNLKIKFRESFRPFAPAVLENKLSDYFDTYSKSPYMLLVAPIAEKIRYKVKPNSDGMFGIDLLKIIRSKIPAVTHVDYSARIQTVNNQSNPMFYNLLTEFDKLTGCPVLINTSFNVRGEPIVLTPEDSYRCFMRTNMDVLVVGNFVFIKEKQPKLKDIDNWKEQFVLD